MLLVNLGCSLEISCDKEYFIRDEDTPEDMTILSETVEFGGTHQLYQNFTYPEVVLILITESCV